MSELSSSRQKLLQNNDYLFYLLNLVGWAGYSISIYVGVFYWDKNINYYWALFLGALFGMLLSFGLRPIYRHVWHASTTKQVITVIVVSYLFSILWVIPNNLLFWEIYKYGYRPTEWYGYIGGVSNKFYIFLGWSFLYFGIKFYQGMQEASQSALKANALAHQAQLKMLRYQLNPHFLFNTLNAISTLVLDNDSKRANQMVVRLSNFLRYSLDNDPMQKVTLAQEITTLKLYLGIEQVRFDERLIVKYDIESKTENALIPSLILQPLVENSIKYAIANSEQGGTISLKAKIFANELLLELCDDGPGAQFSDGELPNGRGVGVRNTKERLQELYPGKHSFTVSNAKPSGLQICIRLPYQVAQD